AGQMHQGKLEEALRWCLSGQGVCPEDAELLFLEGALRMELDDLEGAKVALSRLPVLEAGPHFASVAEGLRGHRGRHLLAQVCLRRGELLEAEQLWLAVLEQKPNWGPALLGLAEVYLQAGRREDPAALEGTPRTLPGGELEGILWRGRALLAQKEFARARMLLEAEVARDPRSVAALVLLSHVLLQEGLDLVRAEQVLRTILALEPGQAGVAHNLKVLLSRRAG